MKIIPRVLIGGTASGVGKTSLSAALMMALKRKGWQVQGFKVGPDYIDPTYHVLVTGRPSWNLDVWMVDKKKLVETFLMASEGADVAVVEGAMGLFDGIRGTRGLGSSADIARILGMPVVLVVDGRMSARSLAAVVYGFANFEKDIKLAGVIINRARRGEEARRAIEEESGIKVLGVIQELAGNELPARHLGLIPVININYGDAVSYVKRYIEQVEKIVLDSVDIDQLINIALDAGMLETDNARVFNPEKDFHDVTLAVAYDEAFCFYYTSTFDILRKKGVKLKFFSPLRDQYLPSPVDGLYLGGGYPEEYVDVLAQNHSLREEIRRLRQSGGLIYAECGGLMYLCEKIVKTDGGSYPGVGIVPADCYMTGRLAGMGYRYGRLLRPCVFGGPGQVIKGHEFHYSYTEYHKTSFAYELWSADNRFQGQEGFAEGNLLATYLHVDLAAYPNVMDVFLSHCKSGGDYRCGEGGNS